MPSTLKQLPQILKKELAVCYLVHGEEELLIQEAQHLIRSAARNKGHEHRERLIIETSGDWPLLFAALNNQSLFSEKKILEVSVSKWLEKDVTGLLRYLENPNPDIVLLILSTKITSAQQKTQWFKALAQNAEIITIWPLPPYELPQWLQEQMRSAKLNTDTASIKVLIELTEGHLFAAKQAIEKLKLLYPNDTITPEKVTKALADNSRFQIYDLSQYVLQGNALRVTKIIRKLQQEGEETILVLWNLCRDIRQLITIKEQVAKGISVDQALSKEWQTRKLMLKTAVSRLSLETLYQLLKRTTEIDQIIKGIAPGNPWQSLEKLSLSLTYGK